MDALVERPYAFDFYRAVRLLESLRPDLPRVGYSNTPAEDIVRFWQKPSLRFAPAALDAVTYEPPKLQPAGMKSPPRSMVQGGHTVPWVSVNFFGLFGPNAPLPPHITEYVLERELHAKDPTITAFFNIFHHRLLSFFYRAWASNQKALDLDRPDDQRFATYIGALFGIGMDSLRQRDDVPDNAKLFFAGRLASQTRNAEGLEAILKAYFSVPVELQPFTGRWLPLPKDSRCVLGKCAQSGTLGVDLIVGERFWDCQLSFRVRFGPMSLEDYERLLPDGSSFKRLKYWILNYCEYHFFWDVQLVLKAEEVPEIQLGSAGRLGWTSWLKTKPFTADADQLILNPPVDA